VKKLEWLQPFQRFTPDCTGHGLFWQLRGPCPVLSYALIVGLRAACGVLLRRLSGRDNLAFEWS
jgi:hypothetical protein